MSWDIRHASPYEALLKARREFRRYGIALLVVALATSIPAWWTHNSELKYSGFVMFMLGLYCTSLADFQARMAKTQAQLDMKRIALEMAHSGIMRMSAGARLQVNGPVLLEFDAAVSIKVIK